MIKPMYVRCDRDVLLSVLRNNTANIACYILVILIFSGVTTFFIYIATIEVDALVPIIALASLCLLTCIVFSISLMRELCRMIKAEYHARLFFHDNVDLNV